MATFRIKDFSEIDFVNIDPARDQFIFPDGKTFRFSDYVCHSCWSGGTVLETVGDEEKFVCILCGEELSWHEFTNDFLPPIGDTLSYLLPKSWSEEQLKQWFAEYRERRIAEEKVKERILTQGKE